MDGLAYGFLALAFVLALNMWMMRGMTQAMRLERKLDILMRHSGIDLVKVATDEARELLRAGHKIEAIKAYRELTGCGLAEAKTKIESLG